MVARDFRTRLPFGRVRQRRNQRYLDFVAFTNGAFQLHLTGTTNLTFEIETTTSLASNNWTSINTNIVRRGGFYYLDASAANSS